MKNIYIGILISLCIITWSSAFDPTVYPNSTEFLKFEWNSCKVATDWCNTVQIWKGELWAMTRMYCEDIYWESGQKQWSCLDESLEEKRIWFLSENDKNQYYTFQDKLWEENSKRIETLINNFGSKIFKKIKYDTIKAIRVAETMNTHIEGAISKLIMSYPADAGMSEDDTKSYYILTIAKFEMKVMMNRWKQNAGIE